MSSAVLEPPTKIAKDGLESLAQLFKALSDPARLKILRHLVSQDAGCCAPGENICACDLEDVTGLSQPTVSHHMKTLLAAGLVLGEKQGRWMYYRISPVGFKQLRDSLPLLGG